jgi:hypothetical protein
MISIIVCSVKPELLDQLKDNIESTISTDYEILYTDNRGSANGICHVYNELAKTAKNEHLLFLHEDVIFKEKGWGKQLISTLDRPDVGLVGISGAVCKSIYPGTWAMLDSYYYRDNKDHQPHGAITSDVAAIDGCFMAMRKDTWLKYPFDEQSVTGFHLYDMDLSIRVQQHMKVLVHHEIKMEHLSAGKLDRQWIEESIKWHQDKDHLLPAQSTIISKGEWSQINDSSLFGFLFICAKTGCYQISILKMFFIYLFKRLPDRNTRNLMSTFIRNIHFG